MARIEELKLDNIQRVRECFYDNDNKSWTRPEIAKTAGLSMAGTENILKVLLERSEIIYAGEAPSSGGRRSKLYHLNPDYAHIGILLLSHLDEDFLVECVKLDLNGQEVSNERHFFKTCPKLDDITGLVQGMLLSDSKIQNLVVSYPGLVNEDGRILEGDFPKLNGICLSNCIRDKMMQKVSVSVENDVNLAAEGYRITQPNCQNLVVLYQPHYDHAGAGIIVNGNLVRGKGGLAGEVGRPEMAKQMRLLSEDPKGLMRILMEFLSAVVAPERIAWYCPMVTGEISLSEDIPSECQPALEQLKGFHELETLIRRGAEAVGRREILTSPELVFDSTSRSNR